MLLTNEPQTGNARDEYWMQVALGLAQHAADLGEVPVGAVLVLDEQLLGQGWNAAISNTDPTAHAEVQALRHGAQVLGNYRLLNTTLYVTLEPCLMCVGACIHARIKRLVFGASESKTGAVVSSCAGFTLPSNHRVSVSGGILALSCTKLLRDFFQQRR
jgi:tRNA(adenine34) deaminase